MGRKNATRLLKLYEGLQAGFGPQNWWPADSRFEVIVGAILTQNTNWKNAEKAIANLKAAKKLDAHSLLKTPDRKLETLIRPSGFFRQKTERLKSISLAFLVFENRGFAPSRDELLEIKGVGKETADSILLYAYHQPHFVIDAYTRRFCSYYSLLESKEYDDYKKYFESSLPPDIALFKEYHALIVEWGKINKRSFSN